jgi:hypothetical protein
MIKDTARILALEALLCAKQPMHKHEKALFEICNTP